MTFARNMSYKYQLTDGASNDIRGIVNYITYVLCNPEAADSFLNEFELAMNRLCDFPCACPQVNNLYIDDSFIRRYIIKKYIAYYRINEKTEALIILCVHHSSEDSSYFLRSL